MTPSPARRRESAARPVAKSDQAAAKANSTKPTSRVADADNWDARVGFLMHDVSRLRRSVFDEFVKPLGLTRSQWWVLAYLSRHDGMIQSDLANVLDLGKAALGGLIDRLQASGFIERRSDDSDRRVKRVHLSGKGAQMVKQMNVRSHEMSESILQGLDHASRQSLADMLGLVKRNLLALRGDAAGATAGSGAANVVASAPFESDDDDG